MNTNTYCKNCYLLIVSLVLQITMYAQNPVAQFSANNISGCVPLIVTYNDQSTGNPTTWKWDLGNGTISVLQNPSAVYTNPGIYSVKLVVKNNAGKDSLIKTNLITVYAKPTVNFSTNTSGCVLSNFQFSENCTAGSGNIMSRQWDFGDGNFSNIQQPSHVYTSSGLFNVSLKITNSYGCFESLTKLNYISINNKPNANFTNSNPLSCSAPMDLVFQNQTTGSAISTYNWDFGDGTFSSMANPIHTYTTPGTYTVKLKVSNSNGCTDSIIKNNLVRIENNISRFICSSTVCAKSALIITNQSNPTPISTNWYFGDSSSSTDFSPVKMFTMSNNYTIRLINDFGNCKDTLEKIIAVKKTPTVDFTASKTSACVAPLNTQFTNLTTNASSYKWLFGDGSSSTSFQPSHIYNSISSNQVTLVATSSDGCVDSLIKSNYIILKWPVATIGNLPKTGCAPLLCQFTPVVIGGDSVVNYWWEFGDGATSTLKNPAHTYLNRGFYNIKLKIVTQSGCNDTVIYNKGIKVGNKPHADFMANPTSSCASASISFTDLTPTTDSVNQWLWTFGDGSTSTSKNPRHQYTDTSSTSNLFDVRLIVYDNGCADTLLQRDLIQISSPIAIFTSSNNCINRLNKIFINKSKGGDSWFWTFGDGTTSNLKNPTHDYPSPGNYSVRLIVFSSSTGCSDTVSNSITIINERPNFVSSQTIICKKNSSLFSVSGINNQNFNSFNWNFGDGVTGSGNSLTKIYYNPGIYTIKLFTVDKNGCKDTVIKNDWITVNGPTALFTNTSISACPNTIISLSENSSSDGRNSIVNWIWNYGDGQIDTLTAGNTQHLYTNSGNYTVSLKVIDNKGCSDLITKANLVAISKPTANFATNDSVACPFSTIHFTNKSVGSNLQFNWLFGDGTTSNQSNPTHSFASTGQYFVRLKVTNTQGCVDSITKSNVVRVIEPIASFSVSDSIGNCPPLVVSFQNNSVNSVNSIWDFGDGNITNLNQPSHFYSVAGTFYAKIKVTSIGGCTDSAIKKIVVHGPSGNFHYPHSQGCTPINVAFNATAINTNYFVWDFGDGNISITTNSMQSHSYSTSGAFIPKLLLKDSSGCVITLTGTDTILSSGGNAFFNFTNRVFCDNGSVQFIHSNSSLNNSSQFLWLFGDGTRSNIENPIHTYTSPGVYTPRLIVQSLFGCIDSMTSITPIVVGSNPRGNIKRTSNGCAGVTIQFNGLNLSNDTTSLSWQWNFGNGNFSNQTNPTPQNYPNPGSYPVTAIISNQYGCTDTLHTMVESYPYPVVNAGNDTFVCLGSGTMLQAIGADHYEWSPATYLSCRDCNTPITEAKNSIQYIVRGTSIHGCASVDSIHISVRTPFTMTATASESMCSGDSKIISAQGALHYSWYPTTGLSNPFSASPIASPNMSTIYRVIGTDDQHCFSDTAYTRVIVNNYPTVELGDDRTINVGQTIELIPVMSSDVISVQWNPSESLSRNSNGGLTIKPNETTTYQVEVSNAGGCRTMDQVTVNVLCNGANLFIPNTFSPNNDGMNDVFFPRGTGIFTVKSAKIYTRWGQKIYERNDFNANDITKGWDGRYKGTLMNTDVYIYVIEVQCDNHSVLTFKGNVSLVK